MADPMSTSPLDSELRELGRWLELPPERDVAAEVRARLAAGTPPGDRRPLWSSRAAAVLVLLVALAATVVAASPRARAALLDLLRIGSVQVHSGSAPSETLSPSRSAPVLPRQADPTGRHPATLDAARRSAAFPVLVPAGALAQPDEVIVEDGPHPTYVSLRYRAGPGRPPAGPSGMSVQIDEIDGDSTSFFHKYVDLGGARPVRVGEAPGIWIDGPHELIVADRTGRIRFEPSRLAARTLVWQRGGVTLRLEGELTLQEAVAVAAGMR